MVVSCEDDEVGGQSVPAIATAVTGRRPMKHIDAYVSRYHTLMILLVTKQSECRISRKPNESGGTPVWRRPRSAARDRSGVDRPAVFLAACVAGCLRLRRSAEGGRGDR